MINRTQEEIIANWKTDEIEKPLVSIRCITYNQEKYISETLDSFLMQKTSFPFEIVIHDDASTDRNAEIIKTYEEQFPLIVRPIYETENQWSKNDGSLGRIVNSALRGEYIAYCEGDDYWIDEYKLQKQVDFLVNNPDFGMCYTKRKNYLQDEDRFVVFSNKEISDYIGRNITGPEDLILSPNPIGTLTVCLRHELLKQYQKEVNPGSRNWLMGDYPMWLWFAGHSKIGFLDCFSAVYRVLPESASHSVNVDKAVAFRQSVYDVKRFYGEMYGIDVPLWDKDEYKYELLLKQCSEYYNKQNCDSLLSFYKIMPKELRNFEKRMICSVLKFKILFILVRKSFSFYKLIKKVM